MRLLRLFLSPTISGSFAGSQLELLAALVNGTTTPIVLVLIHGRTASFGPSNALLAAIPAVLEAGRPGQAGATAIVEIITGAVNPSGKLVTPWVQVHGGAHV